MSAFRSGLVSGSFGFASRAVVQATLFGVTIVATRSLSIEAFGTYALASLFLILCRALFYVGPYEYLLKSPESANLGPACFGANLVLALLSAALLAPFYIVAPLIFETTNVSTLVALLIPSLFMVATTAWYEATLLRAGRVRRYYLSTLLGDLCGAAAAVLLLLEGFGVGSLVVQTYVRLGVLLVFYVFSVKTVPGLGTPWSAVREVLGWSRARYAAVLLNFTSVYSADLVLGVILSPAATGLYRASNRVVSSITDLFAQPLQKISQTNLSARYARKQELGTSWLTMLSGVGAVAWAGLLTLAVLADDLVPFVLGAKWVPAVPIVIALCVVKCFALLDAVTTSFLVCHDQQRAMLRVQIATSLSAIFLAVVAAPFGVTAVAMAVGLSAVGISVAYGVMVMRLSRSGAAAILDFARTSAPPVLAVALGLALFKTLAPQLDGAAAIAFGSIIAALAFGLGLFSVRLRMVLAIGSLGQVAQGERP